MDLICDIAYKHEQQRRIAPDLGPPDGQELTAGSGGREQRIRSGSIFCHANTGAHEVHSGISCLYKREGGPGPNHRMGRNQFDPPREYLQRGVPPYDEPLVDSGNARDWWDRHAPLVVETASLGAIGSSAGNRVASRRRASQASECSAFATMSRRPVTTSRSSRCARTAS